MLVTTKVILDRAGAENYAVAATNVANSVEVNAAIEAAEELNAPLILDVLQENMGPCPKEFTMWMRACCEKAKVPIAINLDDGKTFDGAVKNIQYGATSVMVDRSSLPFEENVAKVKKIVEFAHAADISCEAELRNLGMFSDDMLDVNSVLTNPEDALKFIQETGADCLAVAIRKVIEGMAPQVDFERLVAIKKAVGNFPLVLHGSLGIPNDQLYKACRLGLNKVNISKDLKFASMQAIINSEGKGNAMALAKEGFKNKLKEMIAIYGSDGKG